MSFQFRTAAVGGTFDHLHKGHEALLTAACTNSHNVFIGLATKRLLTKKQFAGSLQTFQKRKKQLEIFLTTNGFRDRCTIIPINTFYGKTTEKSDIDAIFVTEETKRAVPLINAKRVALGMHALHQVVVPFVYAKDGNPISSERIRSGHISREGTVYAELFTAQETFSLPQNLRPVFRKPFGTVYKDIQGALQKHKRRTIICVGDIVTISCLQQNMLPAVAVIDGKTRRETLDSNEWLLFGNSRDFIKTSNPPGTLSREASIVCVTCIDGYVASGAKSTILVEGEEDLLVVPSVLCAPLNTIVLYGQYEKGVVAVWVTEKKKAEMAMLFTQFV